MGFRAGVLTVSDGVARGLRRDESGRKIIDIVTRMGGEVVCYQVVPDEQEAIAACLREMADARDLELILTTGGTGLAPRDVTPEATLSVVERQVPGLPELMRFEGVRRQRRAARSRGVAGVRGQTRIVNLAGSP
ncbi:MAG: MogA/MoaB family molybdenum cofactor biosynthesis protein, partial [Firmicutes bacterium]|nr:MogA/MoaB family molybdenum cofactor biosynthesis protein [Bacillota bacterium]